MNARELRCQVNEIWARRAQLAAPALRAGWHFRPVWRLALLGVALFQGDMASARSPEPVQTQRPLPISAHNCYPQNSASNARLIEALGQGIDNIEIDLGWDAAERRLIVGHDAEPRPGVEYPELASYLVPAL